MFRSWLRRLANRIGQTTAARGNRRRQDGRAAGGKLRLESLENRLAPAGGLFHVDGIGAFDPSAQMWYLRNELSAGSPDFTPFAFGAPGFTPVVGDWAGSGRDGVGAYDPSTQTWYLRNELSAGAPDFTPFAFGLPNGSTPVVGDWGGVGHDGVGAYDPSTQTWYLRDELSAGAPDFTPFAFGAPGFIPVVGDWNGSGHDGIGAYDPTTATWYLRDELNAGAPDFTPFVFGAPGWIPVVGDWNGSGHDGIGAYDPSTATWHLRNEVSAGPADAGVFQFGIGQQGVTAASSPVVGDWDGLLAAPTTLKGVPNPAAFGASVIFAASVSFPSGSSPAGTVTFTVDGAPGSPVLLGQDGTATLTTSTLTAGPHTVTAAYSGSAPFAPSVSNAVTESVFGQPVIDANVGSTFRGPVAVFGDAGAQGANFTATISWGDNSSSAGTVAPTGNGEFTVSGSHTYLGAGAFPVSVQAMDPGGRTFTVQNTANIDGHLVVQGTGGNDALTVLRTAGGGTGDLTYVLNSAAPVSLTGVTDFAFLAGAGADTLALNFVNGVPQITGVFNYEGGTGADRLVVDESALKAADVIGLAPGVVYSSLTHFAVFYQGTSGGLFAPAFAGGVLVVTGTGDSSVYVYQPDRMTGIPFGVQSGGGADQLVINDTDLNGFDEVGVTSGGVFSPVGWSVDFVAAGGSFGRGVYLTTGGGGAEVYVVRPDNMGGVPFTVTSTGAHNALALIETGRTSADTVGATPGAVFSTASGFTVNYSGTFGLGLFVLTGSGNDAVDVYNPDLMNGTPVDVDAGAGVNYLAVIEAGRSTPTAVNINPSAVFGTTFDVNFQATGGSFGAGLVLALGDGNNGATVLGAPAGGPTIVLAGNGNDDVNVLVASTSGYDLVLDGGAGTDALVVTDVSGGATVTKAGDLLVFSYGQGGKQSDIADEDFETVFTTPAAG